ncbi:MAG: type II toxin-antitoxin system HicB family antitoxin [Chloroflexota bacterium]|nr:type II toxin-antitoxin system HicB family antitoxin [Chloroflexota bacterium]
MDYIVVIHTAEEGGYWAEFPGLPGCYTQGETIEEVLEDAPLAVQSHVEALHEFGQPVPHERVFVTTIQSPAPSAA